MEKPLVSVIVLCYNHERYIRDCLDGILMQETEFPFEVMVGDDCSTDGTLSVIRDYHKKFPDVIRVETTDVNLWSQGVSMSYSRLVPMSRGRYLAFCEGDDYWTDPHKLQRQADFMEENPEYSMCYHDYSILDKYGKTQLHPYCLRKDCDSRLSEMLHLNSCQVATVFFRRGIMQSRGFRAYFEDPEHCYGDMNYNTACFDSGRVRHLSGNWSVYRKHDDSVTAMDKSRGKSVVVQMHLNGIRVLIRHYGRRYRYLLRNFRSARLLELSSALVRRKLYLSGILLKLVAFMLSPCFVSRLYSHRYCGRG